MRIHRCPRWAVLPLFYYRFALWTSHGLYLGLLQREVSRLARQMRGEDYYLLRKWPKTAKPFQHGLYGQIGSLAAE